MTEQKSVARINLSKRKRCWHDLQVDGIGTVASAYGMAKYKSTNSKYASLFLVSIKDDRAISTFYHADIVVTHNIDVVRTVETLKNRHREEVIA